MIYRLVTKTTMTPPLPVICIQTGFSVEAKISIRIAF